ncbi:MAG: hypothetical protein WAO20_06490 [Acidobacteriota bacterium]
MPDLWLERYRLGEMSLDEAEVLRRRLETDAELQARLRALGESDEEIGRRYPSGWLADRIREKLQTRATGTSLAARRSSLDWRLGVAVATAVVLIAVGWHALGPLPPQPVGRPSSSTESVDRIKGDRLVLFRRTPEGGELLSDGAWVHAGDQIRIGYRAADPLYGVILSIDGRGTVTRHLPRQGPRAVLLTQGGLSLLDHAYELDEAPGWERFYLVSSPREFDIEPILDAARQLAAAAGANPPGHLRLSPDLDQSGLVLMKEVNR